MQPFVGDRCYPGEWEVIPVDGRLKDFFDNRYTLELILLQLELFSLTSP